MNPYQLKSLTVYFKNVAEPVVFNLYKEDHERLSDALIKSMGAHVITVINDNGGYKTAIIGSEIRMVVA
jgi:hypothetical protein